MNIEEFLKYWAIAAVPGNEVLSENTILYWTTRLETIGQIVWDADPKNIMIIPGIFLCHDVPKKEEA